MKKIMKAKPLGDKFPYDLKKFIGKSYGNLPVTPYGNTFTAEFAKASITAEKLALMISPIFWLLVFQHLIISGTPLVPIHWRQKMVF